MGNTVEKDIKALARFIEVYCEDKHQEEEKLVYEVNDKIQPELCQSCTELLRYSTRRRILCPQDPKLSCKNCEIHCYAPEQREGR